jgi:translation initiation factor eIF-2B subunit epsilon
MKVRTLIDKTPLGKDSNAIVWPRGPPDEEDDEEGPENWQNQRFMRIGSA